MIMTLLILRKVYLFFFFFLYNISDCCTELQQLGLTMENLFLLLELKFGKLPLAPPT